MSNTCRIMLTAPLFRESFPDFDRRREGFHASRRCSGDAYPSVNRTAATFHGSSTFERGAIFGDVHVSCVSSTDSCVSSTDFCVSRPNVCVSDTDFMCIRPVGVCLTRVCVHGNFRQSEVVRSTTSRRSSLLNRFYKSTSFIRNRSPPLGPPQDPRHRLTVGY